MTTGEKIYESRRKAGMTQEELADRLDVSRQAVSKWESDAAFPETEKIVELCKLFHLSADELLLGAEKSGSGEAESVAAKESVAVSEAIAVKEEKPEEKPRTEEKPRRWNFDNSLGRAHFEYVSKLRIGNLPLVHINIGLGAYKAKGVIAIGNAAKGVLALGLLSVGVFSFGLLSLGLFAFGLLAFGLLMGAGGVATGLFAAGGIAIGILCFGGVAIGYIGVGGCAIGQYALGGYAHGHIAVGVVANGENAFSMPTDYALLCEFLKENVGGWLGSFIKNIASTLGK